MKNRIRHTIQSHTPIQPAKAVVIGVSGGSDSVALLHILSALYPENERIAVYIDHGLRPLETDTEKKLVQRLAKSCSARFISVAVDVSAEQKKSKCSIEEAARNLRYQSLEKIRSEYDGQCIAVGHTSDDQAEEVLLRLIRGSGSAGLGGMAIENGYLMRPLLHESKANLRSYLKENAIPYCEDSSNRDTRFLRNRIRHQLLPMLEQDFNHSMRQTLLQTASILHEENRLLDILTATALQRVSTVTGEKLTLHLPPFSLEHVAIQRRILETICWKMSSRPTFKQIGRLLKLQHAALNSELHLSQGLRAIKGRETLLFLHPSQEAGYRGPAICNNTFSPLTIPSPGDYPVPELGYTLRIRREVYTDELLNHPDTLLLDESRISFPLTLRPHKKGETFHPMGAPGKKKISRFLTDQKIAAPDKGKFPVLLSQDTILAVIGLRIEHNFRISDNSLECLQLQWQKTDSSNSLLKPI